MAGERLHRVAGSALLAAHLAGCVLLTPLPRPTTLAERLQAFPTAGLPLQQPVVIYWDAHQVPYVEAETDDDLAFTLGLIHAHLRLGQMEMLRLLAEGRTAEAFGPWAVDLDRSLRMLAFGRAVPAMVDALPEATRRWLDAFVGGINHYLAHVERLPHEFAVLGLAREPWRIEDLLTIGRLVSSDVNWLVWFRLLRLRDRPDWPALWQRLVAEGTASMGSFGPGAGEAPSLDDLGAIIGGVGRVGSNALVVSGARSASGGALIASDPHLGLQLPNPWLLAGFKSPSYHAVGLMLPGLPFIALGRNPWIAWGGTNMHAASSDLYDISGLAPEAIRAHSETIRTRWWLDGEVTIRDSAYGPVISDAPLLDAGPAGALALRWMGHRPSDEMTAMLRVNRARNWGEFKDAFDGFAVPGQNMLYADTEGHIGQVMAVSLPKRAPEVPPDLPLPPSAARAWEECVTASGLPSSFDPAAGFLASANNRPAKTDLPVGYFFSPNDRIARLTKLMAGNESVSLDDLKALQGDVYKASALAFRDRLLAELKAAADAGGSAPARQRLLDSLAAWDGRFTIESTGALAYELLLFHYVEAFYDDDGLLPAYGATWRARALIRADFDAAAPDRRRAALRRALAAAAEAFARFEDWGDMHHLRLAHPLSLLPLIGRRYRFVDEPVAGSYSTLMTTGHQLTDRRHYVRFGSSARHISDLADPDRNYFVLLGGEDGWINSENFLDQLALWRAGDYIQLPLRLETVRALFPHRMTLMP